MEFGFETYRCTLENIMGQLPTEDTPVEIIITLLRGAAPWLDNHRAALAPELDDELDTGAEVAALTHALDLSWQHWKRELRVDVDLTARRATFITDTRVFLTGLSASVERRIRKQGLRENLIRDFVPRAPSFVRNPTNALRTLKISRNGLVSNPAIFHNVDGHDLVAELDGQAAALIARAEQQLDDEAREYGETRAAQRAYERALDAALDGLADLQGAAEASVLRDAGALAAFKDLLASVQSA